MMLSYFIICAADKIPKDLTDFLREHSYGLTVLVKTPADETRLAALAPFTSEYPIPAAGVRYYLCRGKTCERPVETIAELEKLMSYGQYGGRIFRHTEDNSFYRQAAYAKK